MIANKYSHIVNLSRKHCRGNHALCYCINSRLLTLQSLKIAKKRWLIPREVTCWKWWRHFFHSLQLWNFVFRKLKFKLRLKTLIININGGQNLSRCLIVYFLSLRFNRKLIKKKTLQFLVFRLMRKVIYILWVVQPMHNLRHDVIKFT